MIYHSYFGRVGSPYANPTLVKQLIRVIKGGEHTVVFIITITQLIRWESFVEEHGLSSFIQFKLKQPLSNRNYPDGGRKLHLYVLSAQPIERVGYVPNCFCKST